jgi:hypothetical protein
LLNGVVGSAQAPSNAAAACCCGAAFWLRPAILASLRGD